MVWNILPAFVTTNHVSIIMCKTAYAPGYISTITSILRCADCSSTGSFIKIRSGKYAYFIFANKNWRRRWGRRCWRRTSTIIMVLDYWTQTQHNIISIMTWTNKQVKIQSLIWIFQEIWKWPISFLISLKQWLGEAKY